MATVSINGNAITQIGCGDLQWSSKYRGGSQAASWRVDSMKRVPWRPGDLVDIDHMGWPVFAGTLLEPDGDTLHARGLHYQSQAQSLNSLGDVTTWPRDAVDQAIARGLLDWRRIDDDLPLAPFGEADGPMTVGDLLDRWAESEGKVWRVEANRVITVSDPPTTPRWYVAPGATQLTVAEDSYVTTLFGRYLDSTSGSYATVSATDAAAAAKFGPREAVVDLTKSATNEPLRLSAAEATAIVANRLAMGAARPGWANGLTLAGYELTSGGGSKAGLASVKGGDLIRIQGQFDPTVLAGGQGYIDVIADEVTYVDGADTIDIKPVGLQARTLQDVLTVALS